MEKISYNINQVKKAVTKNKIKSSSQGRTSATKKKKKLKKKILIL